MNKNHEIKETAEGFEAFTYGCLIGVFPTRQEAEQALKVEDADDAEFEAGH